MTSVLGLRSPLTIIPFIEHWQYNQTSSELRGTTRDVSANKVSMVVVGIMPHRDLQPASAFLNGSLDRGSRFSDYGA
jgi:hypothetical protein